MINKLEELQREGNTFDGALTIVRNELVPPGYEPHTWKGNGRKESTVDKMRSIVLTYRFRAEHQRLKEEEGRDFTYSVYVPEVDPVTMRAKHARADHNHLLKRIAAHTRDGGHEELDLRRFEEAVKDDTTGLTLPALLGERKQSTADAEKFLSHLVADFFVRKGYQTEARYVRTIAQWHESTDGRGMSQEERSNANMAMMNMIMDEWMHWHVDNPDLSQIDVNV